jgi:hypothetical protein
MLNVNMHSWTSHLFMYCTLLTMCFVLSQTRHQYDDDLDVSAYLQAPLLPSIGMSDLDQRKRYRCVDNSKVSYNGFMTAHFIVSQLSCQ